MDVSVSVSARSVPERIYVDFIAEDPDYRMLVLMADGFDYLEKSRL